GDAFCAAASSRSTDRVRQPLRCAATSLKVQSPIAPGRSRSASPTSATIASQVCRPRSSRSSHSALLTVVALIGRPFHLVAIVGPTRLRKNDTRQARRSNVGAGRNRIVREWYDHPIHLE